MNQTTTLPRELTVRRLPQDPTTGERKHYTTIKIAGTDWTLPLHDDYRKRFTDRALMKTVMYWNKHHQSRKLFGNSPAPILPSSIDSIALKDCALTYLEFACLEEVVFSVLRGGNPDITKRGFLTLPITTEELIEASLQIASDLGLIGESDT